MLDTAMGVLERANVGHLPTLPDAWEEETPTQLAREAFVGGADLQVLGSLRCESAKDCAAMARAGTEPMRFEAAVRRLLETDASLFGIKEPVNQSAGSIVGTQGGILNERNFLMNTATTTNQSITLSIDGMSCGHCIAAVTKALSAIPGVRVGSVAVGSAVIEASDAAAIGRAVAALQDAGYPARAGTAEVRATTKLPGGCCGGQKAGAQGKAASGGCCG